VEEGVFSMLVIIRGAGDLATGIALRLKRAHISVIMTDIPAPTAIRRTVTFSQAIVLGETKVEDVTARRAETPEAAMALLQENVVPVLADPEGICDKYPHELSGGMLQRAMIAAAIVNRPKLLLLDEPTTALDVTIQAQILEMLKKLNRESGVSMLFISHNLNVVRKLCRRVAVMQRGVLVEEGDTDQVFYHPQHPYTQKLIDAIPTRNRKEERP